MIWNVGDKMNFLLKLKTELGLYHVVFRTTRTSSKKRILTVVVRQKVPDIEKNYAEDKMFV